MTVRQVEFGLFDVLLHAELQSQGEFMAVLEAVRAEVAVNPTPAYNRTAHTFSHIFAGGCAAGYYSYKVGGSAVGRRLTRRLKKPATPTRRWAGLPPRDSGRGRLAPGD